MKRFHHLIIFALLLFASHYAFAQGALMPLDADANGTTEIVTSEGLSITDDNGIPGGYYSHGIDYSVTLVLEHPCAEPNVFCLEFTSFDIGSTDTLYVYDGPTVGAPLVYKGNNNYNPLNGINRQVFASSSNTSGTLTIRFRTTYGAADRHGFHCRATCLKPCEIVTPKIDDLFYRMRNGVIYDSSYVRLETDEEGNQFYCINLCKGDGLGLRARGTYTDFYHHYSPNDTNSTFIWDMGIDRNYPPGPDTIHMYGEPLLRTNYYSDTVGCFDVILSMVDVFGCKSGEYSTVRVRIASSPIRSIVSELPVFCSKDSLRIVIGVSEITAHLVLDTMHQSEVISRVNDARTFIPDGPHCSTPCYSAPVNFTEFPNNRYVTSPEDICSICINYEHSFMGDYDLRIVCPSGRKATLKYKENPGGYPAGSFGGGALFTGYPYGGDNHDGWDGGNGRYCDSVYNMFGIGLDYCFSRNANYTLVDGRPANTTYNGSHYLANEEYFRAVTYSFPPRPSYMRSGTGDAGNRNMAKVKNPSDYANKSNYYKPADDFSSLIGCPLNGTWSIEICDRWEQDNGWVFNWSMDICHVNDNRDCKYDVGIDSVAWMVDTSSGYINRAGKYVGPYVRKSNDSITYAYMSDTAGPFKVYVHVYDDFGCRWDTATKIHAIWAPKPDLGKSKSVCTDDSVLLVPNDRHENETFTYLWTPTNSVARTIYSATGQEAGSRNLYKVMVTNNESPTVQNCFGSDSVLVVILPQPIPNFDASIYPMEGCAPLHEKITNHSQFTDRYLWDFGDGTVSDLAEPSHTFAPGVWDVKYYVFNNYGCKDSLILPRLVTVYENPHADFSWEPAYPTVREPQVQFENRSWPDDTNRHYYWEFQYNPDNPYSYQTVEEESPQRTWNLGENKDGGLYVVRLIAENENTAPSGRIYRCTDTAESMILMINDFLQFPSLVTPNGDGENDTFIIKNLAKGLAYPINRLEIFNRWGARVFKAENIDSEDDFWDPAATHSPTGTYFYHFTARGYMGRIERNGSVEVIR